MSHTMNILMLRRNVGLYGADKVILLLAKQLKQMGHNPVVGVIDNKRNPCSLLLDKAKEMNLETAHFLSESRVDRRAIEEIKNYITGQNIDIVHTHGFKADIYGFLASRPNRIPIVATKHGWTHANLIIRLWEMVDLVFLHKFPSIVAVSDDMKNSLIRSGIYKKKIRTIHNGIDLDHNLYDNKALRAKLNLKEKQPVIGIVARLSSEKGHTHFLAAARKIADKFPDARFLIIGDGSLRENLEELSSNLALDQQVQFLGFRSDMPELYQVMDILVSSSLREGIPMNLLEAMAEQKAVIATKVGGVPQIIKNGISGILIDPENVDMLAEAILDLLKNDEKRFALGKAARLEVEAHFSSLVMSRQYMQVYQQLIK